MPYGVLLAILLSKSAVTVGCGLKVTAYDGDFRIGYAYFDSVTGAEREISQVVFSETYKGASPEVLVGYKKKLYVRMEVAEVRFFKHGGHGFYFFEDLDNDLFVCIPMGKSFSPYVIGGASFKIFHGEREMIDPRFTERAAYEVRFGVGARYFVKEDLSIFAEVQPFEAIKVFGLRDAATSFSGSMTSVALNRINAGVRFGK